jgi:hypothetical protein
METTTYRMIINKRIFLIFMGLFFYVNIFILVVYFSSVHGYDAVSILLFVGVIIVLLILGTSPILMTFRSRLMVNAGGIRYRKLLREKTYTWQDFDYYINNGTSLLAYFRSGGYTTSRRLKEVFIGSRNYIPISDFVNNWQVSSNWRTDPLLRTMAQIALKREEYG